MASPTAHTADVNLRVTRWRGRLRDSGTVILVTTLLVACLVKYGIGLHPEWRRLLDIASAWPDPTQAPLIMNTDRSLLSNLTAPWLLGAMGARTPQLYLIGSLAMVLVAIALPLLMPSVRASQTASRLTFVFVVGGAVPAVLLGWVGGYDAAVVIAMTVAVLARPMWLQTLGWFLLAFSHAAVGAAAFLFWIPMIVLSTSSRKALVNRVVLTAVALALGWLSIRGLTDLWGGSVDRWSLFRSIDPSDLWSAYRANLPLVAFSVLGAGWFVVAHPGIRSTCAGKVLIIEALTAAFVVPLIAVDHTRIASLVLFSAVLAWIVNHAPGLPSATVDSVWRVLAVPAVVLPIVVIWMGAPLLHTWPGVTELIQAGLTP